MNKLILTLVALIFSKSFIFSINFSSNSPLVIKADTIVKPQRDSVIAPPKGWQDRPPISKKEEGAPVSLNSGNAPTLSFPANNSNINSTIVSLYWTKNNNDGTCNYWVRVIDLTTISPLYNYANAGDNSSFTVQGLVAGRSYAINIRAVNKNDANDYAESQTYTMAVPTTATASITLNSINSTTFCGSTRTVTINYSRGQSDNYNNIIYNGYYYFGDTFVELSDKNGDFANPRIISASTLGNSSGQFTAILPVDLPFGTNYKIRIFTYRPTAVSAESAAMTIGSVVDPEILNRFGDSVKNSSLNLCSGSTATIKTNLADTSDVIFQWQKDGVNITPGGGYSKYTISAIGSYKLVIKQGTCPSVTSSRSVTIRALASGSNSEISLLRVGDAIQCTGGSAILTIPYWSDNQTCQWMYNGQNINGETRQVYTATQTGSYRVKVRTGTCTIGATSDMLTFDSSIKLETSLGASTICSSGGRTTISVTPSYSQNLLTSYQWKRNGQNISGGNQYTYDITQAGVYNVTVTQGGCTASTQGLEVKTTNAVLDSINVEIARVIACSYTALTLSSTSGLGNATYEWKKDGVLVSSSTNGPYFDATSNGNYTITIKQGLCEITSKPYVVNLNTPIAPNLYLYNSGSLGGLLIKDTAYVCPGNTIPIGLASSFGISYQWYKNGVSISGATSSSYIPTQRGNYYVIFNNGTCSISSRTVFIETFLPKFGIKTTSQSENFCSNNNVTLMFDTKVLGYGAYHIVWKKNGMAVATTGINNPFTVTESGVYTSSFFPTTGCFIESEPINIKIGEPTTAVISGNSTIASGNSAKIYVNFTGVAPWIFTMSDGTTITTSSNPYVHTVSPSVTTTYTLTSVIGSCGSGAVSGNATITIGTCGTPTQINTQPLSQTKCTGSVATFSVAATGSGTLTYQWKKDGQNISGANNANFNISNLKSEDVGKYSVEVTGNCGILLSNSALLKPVNEVPVYAYYNTVSSVGSSLNLRYYAFSNDVVSTIWQGPNSFASTLQSPVIKNLTLSNTGSYTVWVTNSQGCVGQAVVTTTVFTPNIILDNINASIFCAGGTTSVAFTPPISTIGHNFGVQISNADGSFPEGFSFIGQGQNSPIMITLPNYGYSGTTNYTLRIVDTDYRTNISVPSAIPIVLLSVTLSNPAGVQGSYVCPNSSVQINAQLNLPDNGDIVYQWQKDGSTIAGATTGSYIANQAGNYTLTATKTGCSSGSGSFYLYTATKISNNFSTIPDSYQCTGTTITLRAGYTSTNATYQWKKDGVTISGVSSPILNVSQSGIYQLTITDANCTPNISSDSLAYNFGNIIPSSIFPGNSSGSSVSLSDTLYICTTGSYPYTLYYLNFLLGRAVNNYTYQWLKNGINITNASSESITPTDEGSYSLKVSQGSCTSVSNSIYIKKNIYPAKTIEAINGTSSCTGSTIRLSIVGSMCSATYQWQKDGVDIPSTLNFSAYNASQSGSYRVKITENSTVSYSNSITVNLSNSPTFTVLGTFDYADCVVYGYATLEKRPSGTSLFEWYKDNVLVSSSNTTSLLNIYDAGTYKLKVTNGACVGYSQDLVVSLGSSLTKPIVTSNSGSIVCNSTYAQLNTYTYPLATYEWRRNGNLLSYPLGASTYNWFATQSGTYTVKVTQGSCTATSDPFVLNIGDKQQSIKTNTWSDASTWSCGTVPTISEEVLINKGHTVSVPANYTGFIKDMQLNGSIQYGANAQLKLRTN